MTQSTDIAVLPAPTPLEGDPGALAECLGPAEHLGTIGRALGIRGGGRITGLPSLRAALREYRETVLLPLELPAIRQAWLHAGRSEVRELIALDLELARHPQVQQFGFASQAVGRSYLHRLQPLRDVRLVRRYWAAIQRGEAHGWHPLVYGAVLAIYSVPLRQGLVSYAHLTLGGFLEAGSRDLRLTAPQRLELGREADAGLAAAVTQILETDGPLRLLLPDPGASSAPPSS